MRVLLIEDDSATAQSIELMLKSEGFNVYTTDLGEEGMDLGKVYDYDIILLDLNLPDMSGFEVLRGLRVSKVKTPILILSGLPGIEDKVRGFGFGADDYMTKPFHKDELVARIHAIVRRSKGHAQSVIQTADLAVKLDTKTVEVNGVRVHLTGKEYQMLRHHARFLPGDKGSLSVGQPEEDRGRSKIQIRPVRLGAIWPRRAKRTRHIERIAWGDLPHPGQHSRTSVQSKNGIRSLARGI